MPPPTATEAPQRYGSCSNVAGTELFRIQDNNQDIAKYNEKRTGISLRLGYEFTDHFRQSWTYTLLGSVDTETYPGCQSGFTYCANTTGRAVQTRLTVNHLAQTLSVYPSLSGSITEAARRLMAHDDLD